jgi:hypothetical protein
MKFITKRHVSRRAVLRAGGIAMALPWLDSMQPAFSAEAKQPERFVGVLNYFSFHTPFLFPREAGYDYAVSPYLELLQEHRQDFTIISGLNHPEVRDGHASDKSFFTGAPHPGSPSFRNTISLDQFAAEAIGHQTRYGSLNFSTSAFYSCSYTRNGVALPPEISPARAFSKLFISGTPAEVAEEVMRVREGRSILDRVASEAKRLEREVGPKDRVKLDQYYSSVRDLEKRMVQAEHYASQPKPAIGMEPLNDPAPGEDIVRFGLLLEVARLAMQVDLTRIVTLYYVGSSKSPSMPGASFAYHDLSHHGQDSEKIDQLAILERDLLREWGRFLSRMKETGEGNSRLLDHTFAVLGAGMGNASSHDATNLPLLVSGGRFRHGQHLAHDPKNSPPLCNLWVNALQHLGMESEAFGSSTGTLPGLA